MELKEKIKDALSDKKVRIIIIVFALIFAFMIVSSIVLNIMAKEKQKRLSNITNVSTVSQTVLNKQTIVDGINGISPYVNSLISAVSDKQKDTHSFNNQNISIEDYINNLNKYIKTISSNINKLKSINCPSDLNQYKQDVLNENTYFLNGMQHEILYVKNKNISEETQSKNSYSNYSSAYNKCQSDLKSIKKTYNITE